MGTMQHIENITKNKLDTLYTRLYEIIKIKDITVYLTLSKTKIYLKFYISLLKKALIDILFSKI